MITYRLLIQEEVGGGYSAELVGHGVKFTTQSQTLHQVKKRAREALATFLDDEEAAAAAHFYVTVVNLA